MVKPILYSAELSPAVRGVWLTARAMNLDLENRSVNLLAGEHLKPDYIKMNPQHTVPTLDDNGFIIWDSHAICTYLIDKYGKNDHLYPKDNCIRARINQRLYFDVGVAFTAFGPIVQAVFFKGATEFPAQAINGLHSTYDFLESFLRDDLFMAGNSITVADYCLVATISTSQLAAPILAERYPKLAAWYGRMKAVPFYDIANGQFVEKFRQFIEIKLEANRKAAAVASSTEVAADVAGNEAANDVASKEAANDVASKEAANDVASKEAANDVATKEIANGVAGNEVANDVTINEVANGVASKEVTHDVASNGVASDAAGNEI